MKKLKVLFVCGGNNASGRSPNVDVQAEGLTGAGVDVEFFEVKGKGLKGYLGAVSELKKALKKNDFDVVHAHYGLSGIVASLAGAKPLVVTLMGSELYMNGSFRLAMKFFSRLVWNNIIVQSEKMKAVAGKNAIVLPNGVNIRQFRNVDRVKAKEITGFLSGKHVIWVSNPERQEKNYKLAKETVEFLNRKDVSLEVVKDVPHDDIPYYFSAADALLLTSKWEGSPIVVKEALASGLPVVSVDVGDVKELTAGVDGCYVTGSNAEQLAEALSKALSFEGRTYGIKNIEQLDTKIISKRLKDIYQKMTG